MSKSIPMGIDDDFKSNYEDLELPDYMGSNNNSQPTNTSVASKKQVYIPLKGGNMSVKKKITETTDDTINTAKRVLNNGEKLFQASALAVLTVFSIYAIRIITLNETVRWVIAISIAVVGLRAFVEYFKFLNKGEV